MIGTWPLDAHCPLPALLFKAHVIQQGGSLAPVWAEEVAAQHRAASPRPTQVFNPLQLPHFNGKYSTGCATSLNKIPTAFYPGKRKGEDRVKLNSGLTCSCVSGRQLCAGVFLGADCIMAGRTGPAERMLPVSTPCCPPNCPHSCPRSPKHVKKSWECSPHAGAWT